MLALFPIAWPSFPETSSYVDAKGIPWHLSTRGCDDVQDPANGGVIRGASGGDLREALTATEVALFRRDGN